MLGSVTAKLDDRSSLGRKRLKREASVESVACQELKEAVRYFCSAHHHSVFVAGRRTAFLASEQDPEPLSNPFGPLLLLRHRQKPSATLIRLEGI